MGDQQRDGNIIKTVMNIGNAFIQSGSLCFHVYVNVYINESTCNYVAKLITIYP